MRQKPGIKPSPLPCCCDAVDLTGGGDHIPGEVLRMADDGEQVLGLVSGGALQAEMYGLHLLMVREASTGKYTAAQTIYTHIYDCRVMSPISQIWG